MGILFFLTTNILFASLSFSMEVIPTQSSTEDNIIYLNIGGEHLATTKTTLLLSDMSFFHQLLESEFRLVYDRNNNIFIDYNKNAASLLTTFFTTHQLPKPCNLQLAREVAEYFGSDKMKTLISEEENKIRKPQYRCKELTFTEYDKNCPLYFSALDENLTPGINNTIAHLLNAHEAKIIQVIKIQLDRITVRIQYKFDKCQAFPQKFLTDIITVDTQGLLLQKVINNQKDRIKKIETIISELESKMTRSDIFNPFNSSYEYQRLDQKKRKQNNKISDIYDEIALAKAALKKHEIKCPLCMYSRLILDKKLTNHLEEIHDAKIISFDENNSVIFQYPVNPNEED